MGSHNYLVVPDMKAMYDVFHAPLEKSFYEDLWVNLRNLEFVVNANIDIVDDSKELPLKNFPTKAAISLYNIYDSIHIVSDYDSWINIFTAFIMQFHKDAYILNEYDDKFSSLKNDGYKIFERE